MIAQKATFATVAAFAKAYADATKSGNTTFTLTKNELCGAVDKIGEMITIRGSYDDKLSFLEDSDVDDRFNDTLDFSLLSSLLILSFSFC